MANGNLFSYTEPDCVWAKMPRAHIEAAIRTQIPYFQDKQMISEGEPDLDKIADRFTPKDDIAWSLCFSPVFTARLFYSAFLPICSNVGEDGAPIFVLMPKMHVARCVIDLTQLHVQKKLKKHAKQFVLSIDAAFDQVLAKCVEHHRAESWLHPPLRHALTHIHRNRGKFPVSVISVELWRKDDGCLAAGEIGVQVGAVYTSLTGFSDRKENSGKLQLVGLGRILRQQGIQLWDLGMAMPYKLELGAREVPRKEFLRSFRAHRGRETSLAVAGELECSSLLSNDSVAFDC